MARDLFYRGNDDALEFLKFCSNEELNVLIEILNKEASQLKTHQRYQKLYPNHKEYYDLIIAQIQFLGANRIKTLITGEGNQYKEIVMFFADGLGVVYDKNGDVSIIEKRIIYTLFKKSIDNLTQKEKEKLLKESKLSYFGEVQIIRGLYNNSELYEYITTGLLNSFGKKFLKLGVQYALSKLLEKLIPNPVAIPLNVAMTLKDLSEPSVSALGPIVLYIAYLRSKYEDKDALFRKRYKPVIGSILRTELVGMVDHSGIYIGNGIIIEIKEIGGKGWVEAVSLYDFVYSSSVRTGTSIYIAVDNLSGDIIADEEIAKRAKSHWQKHTKYELTKNNCHSFVAKCILGEDFDKVIDIWSFKSLEKSIKQHLNNGRSVDWKVCDIEPLLYKNN